MNRIFLAVSGALLFAGLVINFGSCTKSDDGPVGPAPEASTFGEFGGQPSGVLVGNPTNVLLRLTVSAGIVMIDTTVVVSTLDANDQPVSVLTTLYDDGKLSHGDDIIGDKVFSNYVSVNAPTPGDLRLRASALVGTGTGSATASSAVFVMKVYSDFTSQDFAALVSTQQAAVNKFKTDLAGNVANLSPAVNNLVNWLQTQPAVQSVSHAGDQSISILYTSGVYGGLFISQRDAQGIMNQGGVAQQAGQRQKPSLPIHTQTVGTSFGPAPVLSRLNAEGDSTVIGNRNVLIYAPFLSAFSTTWDAAVTSNAIFQNAGGDFQITYVTNAAANIAVLDKLTDYGYVLLSTHGSQGRAFATGQIADTNAAEYGTTYKALLKAQKLAIWENMVVSSTGGVNTTGNVYVIRYPYIQDLGGKFPNSVIVNSSCESTMNPDLWDAFRSKGAKAYYGFSKIIWTNCSKAADDTIARRLAVDLKKTGQAYDATVCAGAPNAVTQLLGSTELHYPDSLINGDFELGTLFGWTKDGDGRTISQLASLKPTGGSYMGIISTGLGFTTSTGKIVQTFPIKQGQSTLTVKWNFLSEEFLEYIGSQFQDYFEIAIKPAGGTEVVLLRKTIDALATDFGATDSTAGTLVKVSPGIVFDRGGVYMTDWQTTQLSVTPYAGKRVTLTLRAGDVGDSKFDTAILLDDISVK